MGSSPQTTAPPTSSFTTPPSRLTVSAVCRRTSGSSSPPARAPRGRRPSRSDRSDRTPPRRRPACPSGQVGQRVSGRHAHVCAAIRAPFGVSSWRRGPYVFPATAAGRSAPVAVSRRPGTSGCTHAKTHEILTLSNTYSIVFIMQAGISQVVVASAAQAQDRVLPVLSVLRDLFPQGGLQRGSVVAVPGGGLLSLAIAAGASAAGAWCAVVGQPELGVRAAAGDGRLAGWLRTRAHLPACPAGTAREAARRGHAAASRGSAGGGRGLGGCAGPAVGGQPAMGRDGPGPRAAYGPAGACAGHRARRGDAAGAAVAVAARPGRWRGRRGSGHRRTGRARTG